MSTSKLQVIIVIVASIVIKQIHLIITRSILSSANLQSLPWPICFVCVFPAIVMPALFPLFFFLIKTTHTKVNLI